MEDAQVQGCAHVMLDGLDLHATKVCVPYTSTKGYFLREVFPYFKATHLPQLSARQQR